MRLSEVIGQVKTLVADVIPDVKIGTLEEGESSALMFVNNASESTFFNREEVRDLTLSLLLKRKSQADALDDSHTVGKYLMMTDALLAGEGWMVSAITYQSPVMVEQEKSTKLWVYSTNIDVKLCF